MHSGTSNGDESAAPHFRLYRSPRLARSLIIFCHWLCPPVCHAPSNWFFFFVSRWNRAIFWPSVLHMALYKTLFLDFWFWPPNAQNLLPKICTKSPITRLVWQTDRSCLHLLGGFRGWPIQWNHAKCCGADPCCHGNAMATTFALGVESCRLPACLYIIY